jgi:hypothetical protein
VKGVYESGFHLEVVFALWGMLERYVQIEPCPIPVENSHHHPETAFEIAPVTHSYALLSIHVR